MLFYIAQLVLKSLVYEYMQDLEETNVSFTLKIFEKRPFIQRLFESIARLLSPLL